MSRSYDAGFRASLRFARRFDKQPHAAIEELHQRHGPIVRVGMGRFSYTLVFGADANHTILSTSADRFLWAPAFEPLRVIDGDTALVLSDGSDHERRRRVVLPAFHRRRISSYLAVMADEAGAVVDRWSSGIEVDAHHDLRLAIRRIVLRCLFGDALAARDGELAGHLEVALEYVNRPPSRRLDKDWPGLPFRAAARARRRIDEIVYDEITERRATIARTGDAGDDVLGWLVEAGAIDDASPGLSDQEIRDQAVSLFAAGYDTSASAAGWCVAELASDDAIRTHLAQEAASAGFADTPSIAALQQMPWTDAFVKEVLRRHTPALVSGRQVCERVDLLGHALEPGEMVLFSPHVTHHLSDLFDDPTEFRPGRFIEGDADHQHMVPGAYVPFGGGSRRCLGFAFATQELAVITALVALRGTLELVGPMPQPAGIASSSPSGGVRVVPT